MKTNIIKWSESMNYVCLPNYCIKETAKIKSKKKTPPKRFELLSNVNYSNCNMLNPSSKLISSSVCLLKNSPNIKYNTLPQQNNNIETMLVKMPVLLAQEELQIALSTNIKLNYPAIEIMREQQNIIINKLIFLPSLNKLFVKGYIRKSIEYATENQLIDNSINNAIHHQTSHIDFQGYTEVQNYLGTIIGKESLKSTKVKTLNEFYSRNNITYVDSHYTKFSPNIFFYDLLSAKFNMLNIFRNEKPSEQTSGNLIFKEITEKINLSINLRLFQQQDIKIAQK